MFSYILKSINSRLKSVPNSYIKNQKERDFYFILKIGIKIRNVEASSFQEKVCF